jgi:hypothetical protein
MSTPPWRAPTLQPLSQTFGKGEARHLGRSTCRGLGALPERIDARRRFGLAALDQRSAHRVAVGPSVAPGRQSGGRLWRALALLRSPSSP